MSGEKAESVTLDSITYSITSTFSTIRASSYTPIEEIPMFPTTSILCTQKILHKNIHFPHEVTADLLDFIPEDKPKKMTNAKKKS